MGQIKNIKLHIVTDIKPKIFNSNNNGYRYRAQQRQKEAQEVSCITGSLPPYPRQVVPIPREANRCKVQPGRIETVVHEQDEQTTDFTCSNCPSNEAIRR